MVKTSYPNKFPGQHHDEVILHVVRQHPVSVLLKKFQVILAAVVVMVVWTATSSLLPFLAGLPSMAGMIIAIFVMLIGFWVVGSNAKRNVAYVTDRRVVRFHASSLNAVNSRSLAWEEVVKVKTFAPNFLWRMFNLGTVIVHAKSTFVTSEKPKSQTTVSDNDLALTSVHYYEDLGHYIDKILYMYRRKPKDLENLKPFVMKPKGKRD